MASAYRVSVLRGERMNPNYNQTVTIFNCLRARDNPYGKKDVWQKMVLGHCFYKNVMGRAEYADREPKMASVYTVRVPESLKYKPYPEWCKMPEEERRQYFTCSMKDIVVKGECLDGISGISPDTASEVLSRNKPEAFVVTAFSDNTSHQRARHYRIGG